MYVYHYSIMYIVNAIRIYINYTICKTWGVDFNKSGVGYRLVPNLITFLLDIFYGISVKRLKTRN